MKTQVRQVFLVREIRKLMFDYKFLSKGLSWDFGKIVVIA